MSEQCYTIGVDVGQGPEPSALAVVERPVEWAPAIGGIRCSYLQRLPPGTNYTALARRLQEIEEKILSSGDFTLNDYLRWDKQVKIPEELMIYLDVTDTGKPVVDLIQRDLRADVVACHFMPGKPDYSERMEWRISKLELITQLKIMAQTGRMVIAGKSKDPEGARAIREMTAELENFQYKTPARDDTQELKVGARDDMVTALGLAILGSLTWRPPVQPQVFF